MTHSKEQAVCQVCGATHKKFLCRALAVRPALAKLIQKERGGQWDEQGWICLDDLHGYQNKYVQALLEAEKGELGALETEVLRGLKEQEVISKNPEVDFEGSLSFGQRLADKIADFGGSWTFIISFGCVLVVWMVLNSYVLASHPFDPYPYILLNLVLSSLAALQAPVIMMSQNRQEQRDRARAQHDYQVNLKAELEIRQLHQKLDHLLSHQWERLMEVQEIQLALMEEMRERK